LADARLPLHEDPRGRGEELRSFAHDLERPRLLRDEAVRARDVLRLGGGGMRRTVGARRHEPGGRVQLAQNPLALADLVPEAQLLEERHGLEGVVLGFAQPFGVGIPLRALRLLAVGPRQLEALVDPLEQADRLPRLGEGVRGAALGGVDGRQDAPRGSLFQLVLSRSARCSASSAASLALAASSRRVKTSARRRWSSWIMSPSGAIWRAISSA